MPKRCQKFRYRTAASARLRRQRPAAAIIRIANSRPSVCASHKAAQRPSCSTLISRAVPSAAIRSLALRTPARRHGAFWRIGTLGGHRPQPIAFSEALEAFLAEKQKGRRPRTSEDLQQRLTRHYPFRGSLADITHADILSRLAKIKTDREYNHAVRVARTFFTWAANRRLIVENPTTGLSMRSVASRSRVLTPDETAKVLKIAQEARSSFGWIVYFLAVTGQRRGEIAALQWAWIDLEENVITLPAAVTKNGREHQFPIGRMPTQALSAIPRYKDVP